ncbi:MAG: FtsQ-type POTRA domain-containing protein, partial [Deltaproteobacteria bacterium]|nr:FtsQ-type POTRA domain-containing protein [Deltaproteobacteria bacterium]
GRVKFTALALIGLAGLGLASLGLVAGYQALLTSPFFEMKRLTISGHQRLSRTEITKLTGLKPGMSLLRLNLKAVRTRLEASPWVAQAHLRRVLPDELRIHLVERRPRAILAAGDLWYVDDQGQVFKKVNPKKRLDMPVISGLDPGQLDLAPAKADLAQSLKILRLLSRPGAPLGLNQLSEIQFSPASGAILHPLTQGPRIILGRGLIGLKIKHWRQVKADLTSKGLWSQIAYIDLRFKDRAFVGLRSG